jgi:acyl-CoA synthetase (AMP-forming)/AMP-acid ligase II
MAGLQYTFASVSETVERFTRLARDQPHRPLIHLPATSTTLTAADLQNRYRHFAEQFRGAGIGPAGLVLSAAGNRPGAAAVLLAARTLSAVVLPVDVSTPAVEIGQIATRFAASAIVVPRDVWNRHFSQPPHGGGAVPLDEELVLLRRESSEALDYQDAMVLKLTSGSTGAPKAIVAREHQILEDTAHIVEAMGIAPDDVQIAAIPLSHAYGFGNLLMPMVVRGTAIVLRESFVPPLLPGDADRYRASVFPGVPFMFQYFIANTPASGWPSTLRNLMSAGARLEAETVRGFHAQFGIKIRSFYGTSESGGICFDGSDTIDDEPSVGWPLPGVTVTLRPGEGIPEGYGRVHIKSSAVAAGYLGESGAGEEFTGNGFVAGDYGRFLADGRLLLAGRVSSFINVAGRKVHPGEIERVLQGMPGVGDVRVVGVADARRGQQIVAVLTRAARRDAALTAADVRSFCAARLAPHKIPRAVIVTDAIPLTERGKTDQRALNALIDRELARSN